MEIGLRCGEPGRSSRARRLQCHATWLPKATRRSASRSRAGEPRDLTATLRFPRWGVFRVGRVGVAAFDRLGLFVFERELPAAIFSASIRGRSTSARSCARATPRRMSATSSPGRRARGSSSPISGSTSPATVCRRVNWKATARRGSLVVNEQHPERNSATVLLLDSFSEARLGAAGTLDQAVRATTALAGAYLRRRDQVGLLSFGGSRQLARAGARHRAAVPDRRGVARHRGRALVHLARHSRDPHARAAAEGARAGPHAAARRAHGRRACERAWPRRRRRGSRDRARAVHPRRARASRRSSRTGSGSCAAPPCAAASAASASPSSSGATAIRSSPCWRRCRHSGVTPGRCARSSRHRSRGVRGPLRARRVAVRGRLSRPGGGGCARRVGPRSPAASSSGGERC